MSAPLVVNTTDGTCWTRRTVTRSGLALYAPADVCKCPPFVMATLAELAEHGIVGSADVLPMPVGPEPRTLDVVEEELTGANLSLWEEEQDNARLRLALKSAKRGRSELRELVRHMCNALDCYDCPPPGEKPLEKAERWRRYLDDATARVAELEAERHVTNEALDDAVQALRADPERLSFAERARRERVPARRAAYRMLARSEESERVADALLLTPESGGGS